MLPNVRKWEGGDEHVLSNLETDYRHRVERLQHYVPFLRKMIEHLEGARDKNRETQLTKMRSLLNILTDSNKKLKLSTIQRCEEILQKLYSKVEGVFDWSTGLPNVNEKQNEDGDKDSVEKEDTQSSSGSIQSPQITESQSSVSSSTRDDSSSSLWRRRKTAMEFFEETPRSPSPPPCSEFDIAPQPVVIPMERKEESCENSVRNVENSSRNLESPMRSLENVIRIPLEPETSTRNVESPMRGLENVIRIPLDPKINQSIMALIESKVELPPKPPQVPYERREDFKSKWYQGEESRYDDAARQKSNFSVANSAHPSNPGVSCGNNVAQPPFLQGMSGYPPLQCINSKNTTDIPSLEELRIPRRSDLDYHSSERLHIPISAGGEKFVKDYDHCKQPGGGWSDVMFERRRNTLPFKHQPEPANITVVGKAQVFDYAHGQDSGSDSLESAKDKSVKGALIVVKDAESECDKVKPSPKRASSPRVSIREKLALEINKVHRVGVSSGGALRSLSKDLGSPPHQKKVDSGQSGDTAVQKTTVPVKPKDGEHIPGKNPSKDKERKPSGSSKFADDDLSMMKPGASFYLPADNLAGVSSVGEEKKLPLSHDNVEGDSTDKIPKTKENKNSTCSQPESKPHEVSPDVKVVEEFSFKKRLLESKVSPDSNTIDSPTSAPVVVGNIEDDDQCSKMSICEGDSDSDSKIPFLESTDVVPPPDKANFPLNNSSTGFSDQRHLPNPSISSSPSQSSSSIIQPFVNPSNPNPPSSQGNIREEPTNARIWPGPNPSGVSSFPPLSTKGNVHQKAIHQNVMQQSLMQQNIMQENVMQQNIMKQNLMPQNIMQQNAVHQGAVQQNVNSPNLNSANQANHHGITGPSCMIQPSNSSHNHSIRMDAPRLAQQPQFMSGGSHSPLAINAQSMNQGNRPQLKQGLLPDPVASFRHGGPHNWSQGHGNLKGGLLPLPASRPNWRKESYSRPSMNQYVTDTRSLPVNTCDARAISVRGSWNSRRGAYSKGNDSRDPRVRKQDHSRPYYDSSEPSKKSEEKYWKHPSDPRRANPSVLENKHQSSVTKEKTTISSPLNSLYDADQTPRTGKGYGLQKFRIPKIKSHEVKDNAFRAHIIPRAPTPPRGMRDKTANYESIRADDRSGSSENNRSNNKTGSTENIRTDEGMKEDRSSNASTMEGTKVNNSSDEALRSDEKKEEHVEDKEKKAKEEFTKELFQTLLKFSLESRDGSNILDNTKFLDELREKLKLNPRKKSRPIIESDTESSEEEEEEEECSPLVNKNKKRCRVIIESSESDSSGDEKQDDVIAPVVKSPEKTPPRTRRTPRSRKAVKESTTDGSEERPRTRSQRKLFDVQEDQVVEGKDDSEEQPGGKGGDHHPEADGNDEEVSNQQDYEKIKAPNRRTKRRSSLELLQEDIREMFICEGVMSATGIRMCRLLKEAATGASGTDDMPLENNPAKDSDEWEINSSSSCKDSAAPDNSDENFEITPPRATRRRVLNKKDDKKDSSLQPRVLLKKSEVEDARDYPKAPQTVVRGGCARRSFRRTPNLGNRHQNTKNLEDGASRKMEESVHCENEEEKRVSVDGRELRSRASLNKSSKDDDEKAQSAEGDAMSQLNDTSRSFENSDNSHDSSSSMGECDTNSARYGDNSSISGKNEKEEVEGKENIVHSVIPGKKANKVIIRRTSLKKVNSKAKRSKVNRRWALGVLKRAVNHKRRGLNSSSSPGVIDKETTSVTSVNLPAVEEDLTDINYTCVGNESARCKLCSYSGKQIVNHYVTKHPESDVLVSRLSLQQAKIAIDWTEMNQSALKNAEQAYKSSGPFVCLMCEAWFTEYIEFFDHVTTHTGEYRFSCKTCSYRSFRDSNVRSHAYYVHQIKYCESYECFDVIPVEDMSYKFVEEGDDTENSSCVIPGLVAHMCSKCNFVQISEKNLKDHIAKRHGEDVIKILKIDLSLISPEPPPIPSNQIGDEVEDDVANSASEDTNVSIRDDDDTNASFKDCHSTKEENGAVDLVEMAQVKKEKEGADESSVEIKIDETVFVIDDLLDDPSNKNCNCVWSEILENPECDSEVSVVKLKLSVKIEDAEEKSVISSLHNNGEVNSENQSEGSKLSNFSSVANESSKGEHVSEINGVNDFAVIQPKGGKKQDERKADGIECHSSEVEIIEIGESDSSDSEDSSDDESSSESENEWTAPHSSSKESLFSLGIVPDVKVRNEYINISSKLMKIKESIEDLELKAVALVGGDGNDAAEYLEEDEEVDDRTMEVEQNIQDCSSTQSESAVEEVPEIKPCKIRVRCLSGDLLSSTRDCNSKDENITTERDPFIDVIGSPLGFESSSDNPLCQISSVCSLHPNEQVPEEFIKAVSETETPDLTSLAAYTPTSGSPQSLFTTPEDMTCENILYYSPTKGVRSYRPILPKPPFPLPTPPARVIQNNDLSATNGRDLPPKKAHVQKFSGEINDFQTSPPKSCIDSEEVVAQPCNQVKICSVMRASLYAKASKTPNVFNQVMSNQVKLCHLFKCMGRQCSFTTDESVLFLSHYLGHESLVSDTPAASSSSSGENNDNQEKRFDWQQCCYCAEMFSSGSAYINHVKIEHGDCVYQCPYCFYRAAAVSYVILHQNSTHITEKVSILHCKNPLKKDSDDSSDLSPIKPHVEPYVCFQGNCKRSFYSPNRYLTHLQVEHSAVSMFCCHKCGYQCFKAERLLQHYKLHSFFLYQCVYCDQGSDTSEEILQHLASFHPNRKASVCKRNCQETSNGSARTTGRHPYILYEDIELTEMENVEVINVGDETGKNSTVAIKVNKAVAEGEIGPDSDQMGKLTEVDDDNSDDDDDDDNLVIAEEPEEASAKENEDIIMETGPPRIEEEIGEKCDHQKENVREEDCHEVTQEKVIEKENPETEPSASQDQHAYIQCIENESGNKKSKEAHGNEKVSVEMPEDLILCSPTSSGKSSRRNSTNKPPNVEELGMAPRRGRPPKNRDELNVSATDDEIIDVGENNGCQEKRLLRRRDVRRSSGITTRSQVEPKPKNTSEEGHTVSNSAKETASPKEISNGKVDLSELYHCCFVGCSHLAKDWNSLKYHMKMCPKSKDGKEYVCPHCGKKFKVLIPALKHLRVHGKKSYVCMICDYQGHNMNMAVRHVKFRHRASNATVSPLTDWDEPDEIQSSGKDQKLVVVAPKEVSIPVLLKRRFVPDDADFLPLPCVYTHDAKCGRCSYSTKVRVNMRRHLYLHLKFSQAMVDGLFDPNNLPWSMKDAVNPMPCLEGKEMMFDKMTNWALSSHLDAMVKDEDVKGESRRNSALSEYEEDNFIPRFVPENERYVCGVIGCHYHTVDDTMLRHHLRALHRDEATFRCPHCPEEQNAILQVPVDRLASHLKMHDDQLYQCIHCNYFHFQRRFVERHAIDKHGDTSHLVNVIREPDTCSKAVSGSGSSGMAGASADGSNRSSRSSNTTNETTRHENDNMWNCGLCSFSCSNRESISDHARTIHSIFSQYVCGMCSFRTAYLSSFNSHFSTKHLGYPVQLVANYFPSNIEKLALPTVTISLPNGKIIFPPNPSLKKNIDIRIEPVIEVWPYVDQGFGKSTSSSVRLKELNSTYPWQRCMPRVRYIRGIPLAEEGEETMYDLAESLKILDVIQNEDEIKEEEDGSPSKEIESDESDVLVVNESGVVTDREDTDGSHEHPLGEGIRKGAKRRMSDPSKDCDPQDSRRRTESGKPLTVKASPSKKYVSGSSSPVSAKVPKIEEPQESQGVENKLPEEFCHVPSKEASKKIEKQLTVSDKKFQNSDRVAQRTQQLLEEGPSSSKLEYLIKQYGEFGEPEGNLFVCPVCSKYKTKYKNDMKDHYFRELNYKRFVCTHCGFLAPLKSRLQKHYLRVHKKEGKREAIAELPPDSDVELWVTLALNHQCEMMKTLVNHCASRNVNSEESMLPGSSSSQTHPEEGGSSKTPYSCKYCGCKFSTTRGVKLHFKIYHLKIGSWICGYCDMSANSSAVIIKHTKSSHPERQELVLNNSIGSFIDAKALDDSVSYCDLAPTIADDGSKDVAASTNSEGPMLYCSNCNYQTKILDDLKIHEKSHTYGCGHCLYTASQESDINIHHLRNHSSLPHKIINRSGDKGDQHKGKSSIDYPRVDDSDITLIDLCSEPEDSKDADSDISVDQEIIVTLENIGEYGKSNPSFVFKCYYCRMKSFLCDDVVNHWEKVHLPTDIHNTHPFKCKRIFAMNQFTFPHQLFKCAVCNHKGTVVELKGHFKTEHLRANFKVLNLQNTKYCCLLCNFSSYTFAVLENHFKNLHSSKALEYRMKLTNIDGCNDGEDGIILGTVVGNSFKGNSKRDTSEEEQFLKDALYSCCVCNSTFSSFNSFEKHHAQNHDSATLRFSISVKCGKNNYTPSHHSENIVKTYSCSSCPFATQSFSKIFDHIRGHALPYKCGHCDFKAEFPSRVSQHHSDVHPNNNCPIIVISPEADLEMAHMYKELKVTCEVIQPNVNTLKRRALSPMGSEPKKCRPVARKSTTQVFPRRSLQNPTARKSTNPSVSFVRNLKSFSESPRYDRGLSSHDEQDSDSVMSDEETMTRPTPLNEFSYYTGGKGLGRQPVNLSRITVCMTFGGCAAKRVPVSKMAQLVDLEPNLCIVDVMNNKRAS
ncbi:uncharacterized protein LOC124155906 [Ischnura elegans]|uniref:uncharacterized protein LOC124155906 n=1 Tax=Ischnura elegans TaxID=197161 RepID=UPI001ED8B3AC|nr:uncharacterized protein LOC124155906 [Ischnura elegans]XP_046386059.1 uncharacterized protein LOC124155906 [Ischnura elegans]